ncbi:uncharacterized protein B0I36DRAFT_351360 [Microdochium trichocladiopsis]|uniref:Secreted protein n=1 Tax=Microdochium trichocladiopsis TaxID=1682393 RepID=A0A9P9BLA9_9PEZI|nr:uncharacterized protein B0I36DRAFT_351360 [Microdochium trichocladiopsis]KAH7027892.1 hypothetical protein B0I36DRAFT_351360 [Microdochium trichocladiopsis]
MGRPCSPPATQLRRHLHLLLVLRIAAAKPTSAPVSSTSQSHTGSSPSSTTRHQPRALAIANPSRRTPAQGLAPLPSPRALKPRSSSPDTKARPVRSTSQAGASGQTHSPATVEEPGLDRA